MSKVRIAFFLDIMQEDFDGVSITMHQIIKRIPTDRIEPIFITPHPPLNDIGFPVFLTKYMILPEKGKEYRLAFPKRNKELPGILDEFKPDIVHYSSPTFLGWYAYRYAKAKGIPVSTIYHTHYHGFVDYYFRNLPFLIKPGKTLLRKIYALYKDCDRVFAPTKSMKEYLLTEEVKEERISIWGRGVDTNRFNPEKRDEHLWLEIPDGNKKALFVSRLVKEKEPQTLIRLHKLLTEKRPDITLVIVGEGPMREMLESHMPNAHFTGSLFGDDLAKAYASSDVFVFPSTTETFGNVVLEALASGLPVVAANAGGPKDIVKQGETGELVEPQNEEEFLNAIIKLVDDQEYYLKCRSNAIAYGQSQNWESLSGELFSTYLNLAK